MDPLTLMTGAITLAGVGMSIFGGNQSAKLSAQASRVSQEILQTDMMTNEERRKQMTLEFQRDQIQSVRNLFRAKAAGAVAATSQGAEVGSGKAGGYAQAASDTASNLSNLSQNFQIGSKLFDLYNTMDLQKMQLAQIQGKMGKYQGLEAMGGAIAGSAGPLARMGVTAVSSGFGSAGNLFFGGGSPSGYGTA